MPTWKEIVKRQRRRKPKKKVPNIFEGESIPDNERFDQQKKEGRKGTPFKHTGEEGLDVKARKKNFELSRQGRHHKPKHVSYEFGGLKRPNFYGKKGGRINTPKGRCAMCGRQLSVSPVGKYNSWMKADRSLVSDETTRMRYCDKCMRALGGPRGFIKDTSHISRTRDELNEMSRGREKGRK